MHRLLSHYTQQKPCQEVSVIYIESVRMTLLISIEWPQAARKKHLTSSPENIFRENTQNNKGRTNQDNSLTETAVPNWILFFNFVQHEGAWYTFYLI